MKVSELTGAQLDYWVAKAEGLDTVLENGMCQVATYADSSATCYSERRYHDSWEKAGPIIEREKISTECYLQNPSQWRSRDWDYKSRSDGTTLLESALRCYVEAKFGEEVSE